MTRHSLTVLLCLAFAIILPSSIAHAETILVDEFDDGIQRVACYSVAAATAADRGALADRLVGDGLVPLRSALGLHDEARRSLVFPQESQRIEYRTNHMGLLSSPAITRQMLLWLGPESTTEPPRTLPTGAKPGGDGPRR